MTQKFLKFKQNDTYGTIDYTLMNDNGTAFSIPSGASVDFYLSDKTYQNLLISGKSANIVEADSGQVTYQLEGGDLINFGDFIGEFRVTFSDGTIKSFPDNGYLSIHIDQSINNGETEYLIQVTDLNSFKDSISSEVDSQNARIDNLISSTPQPSEVVDARVSDDGTTYGILKDRLDAEHQDVTSKLADIAIDVKSPKYGAVGDGVTDDTVAIQNALNDGNIIYFPQGTYKITSQLTVTGKSINIKGAGIGLSVLQWASGATSEGLSITNSSSSNFISFDRLSLQSGNKGTGTAISLNRTGEAVSGNVQNRSNPRASFSNLLIKGATNETTDGWLKGIDSNDSMHMTFDEIHFVGYYTTVGSPISNSFVNLYGADHPVEYSFVGCWAFFTQNAVNASGTVEGIHIVNCNFVAVSNGVNWSSTSGNPLLAMSNTHVNAFSTNVNLNQINQFVIKGCLFYKRSDSIADGTGVTAASCTYGTIEGCVFVNTSTSYQYNCVVFSGTTSWCSVNNCTFQSGTTGIWFQSSTSNCRQSNNLFATLSNKNFLDQSTTNFKKSGMRSTLTLSSTLSMGNATLTAVTWGSSAQDDLGAVNLTSNPTRITIPSGVSFVNITSGIVWAANSTGERRIEIWKNGAGIPNVPKLICAAMDNASGFIQTQYLPVVAGDYFEVKVYQSSGAALNVLNDGGTFFSVTAVEKQY